MYNPSLFSYISNTLTGITGTVWFTIFTVCVSFKKIDLLFLFYSSYFNKHTFQVYKVLFIVFFIKTNNHYSSIHPISTAYPSSGHGAAVRAEKPIFSLFQPLQAHQEGTLSGSQAHW